MSFVVCGGNGLHREPLVKTTVRIRVQLSARTLRASVKASTTSTSHILFGELETIVLSKLNTSLFLCF